MALCRSYPSNDRAYIKIFNRTSEDVDVLWFNYQGKFVRYTTLTSSDSVYTVDTFKGHPWACVAHKTGVRLYLNHKLVYEPVSVREIHERIAMGPHVMRSARCGRLPVYVTYPMFSLKDLSCYSIMNHLKNEADVSLLQIPYVLKQHLINFYSKRQEYISSVVDNES